MRVLLLGKVRSITGWLEDCASGLASAGHQVRTVASRNPALHSGLETALMGAKAAALARTVRRTAPDLVLVIGPYEVPALLLEQLAGLSVRPPLVGWVGDAFDESAQAAAARFDLIAYTDSALLARHQALGFAAAGLFLPHAVDPRRVLTAPSMARDPRLVFIANPTPNRRAIVAATREPLVLHGQGWTDSGPPHETHQRRVRPEALLGIYARHAGALNIRHETNVVAGLNQRSFTPCLAATAVVSDAQPDLERCFEPAREVLVWRDVEELDAIAGRLRRDRAWGAAVGERGRARVLAEHTFGRRLEAIVAAL